MQLRESLACFHRRFLRGPIRNRLQEYVLIETYRYPVILKYSGSLFKSLACR